MASPRSAPERPGSLREGGGGGAGAFCGRLAAATAPLKIQEWFDPRAAHRGESTAQKNKVRRAAENFAIRAHFSREFL